MQKNQFPNEVIGEFNKGVEVFFAEVEKTCEKLKNEEAKLLKNHDFDQKILRKLKETFDNIVRKIDEFSSSVFEKKILKKFKEVFRNQIGKFVYQSEIIKRSFEKPLGYPGDYLLLEQIYSNKPITTSGLGYYLDLIYLNNAVAEAVRDRKEDTVKIISNLIIAHQANKILNLGCGSCRDIKEIIETLNKRGFYKKILFDCLDFDDKALVFAKQLLSDFLVKYEFRFIKENALNLEKSKKIYNDYDVIYSMGVADYLPDRVFIKFIVDCLAHLNDKGKLIIAHKDFSKYKPIYKEWFCDWTFYHRAPEKLGRLLEEKNIPFKISRGKNELIYFITLSKAI